VEIDINRLHHRTDRVRWLPDFSKWLAVAGGYASFLATIGYYEEYTHPLPYESQPGRVMLGSLTITALGIAAHIKSKRSLRNADTVINNRFQEIMRYSASEFKDRWPVDPSESIAGSE